MLQVEKEVATKNFFPQNILKYVFNDITYMSDLRLTYFALLQVRFFARYRKIFTKCFSFI